MLKKIALFAVWMAVLSVFVYKMAYADCGMAHEGAKCEMKADKAECGMKSDCAAGGTKFNFVPGNRKS